MVKDGEDQLTRIAIDKLGKFRLNFSRCTDRDVAPLMTYFPVWRVRFSALGNHSKISSSLNIFIVEGVLQIWCFLPMII